MLLGKRLQPEERENGTPVSRSISKKPCFGVLNGFEPVRQEEDFDTEFLDVAGTSYEYGLVSEFSTSQNLQCASSQLPPRCDGATTPEMRKVISASSTFSSQQQPEETGSFLQLPEDLILHILSNLSAVELIGVMSVSKNLNGLCHKEYLWRRLTLLDYRRDLIFFQSNCSLLLFLTGWKGFYRAISTMRIDLEFLTGPRSPNIQTIPKRSIAIGRSRSNDVCILQDEMISRRHAVISFHHNRLWIRDVGGINGTFLNDSCLSQFVDIPLHLGDIIEIGASSFAIRPHITIDLPKKFELHSVVTDSTIASPMPQISTDFLG